MRTIGTTHTNEQCKITLFGLDLQDIRGARIEASELHDALINPELDARLQLTRQRYFTRGAATIMPLISKRTSQLTNEDLEFVSKSTKTNSGNMHLDIHVKVWDNWEVLGRAGHVDRLAKARDSMVNLLNYFKSTFRKK